ncbi:MAG: hypothetical protein HW389_747 [Bacteroidetes bacterium]|nr:hypothetical protein [Bacteroidota bacterium]
MSVREIFARLIENPSGHAYTVAPVPGHDDVYLGIDIARHPYIFVRAEQRLFEPPLRTAQISLQLSQEYSLVLAGGAATRQLLHSMRCESSDHTEVQSFLTLMDALLAQYEIEHIDGEKLASFFRSMVKLFSVTQARDLQTERQGLWGELFVMRQTRGFRFWAPFWHSETNRLFDFSSNQKRVEVKSAVGQQRIHHFSHRQVYALNGEEIVIASILLREEDAGLSLRDLIIEARSKLLGMADFLKLERAVRRAGMESGDGSGPMFDPVQADASLRWFRSADTPHFRMPEPPGVSETRYRADLSTAPNLSDDELERWLNSWRPVAVAQAR